MHVKTGIHRYFVGNNHELLYVIKHSKTSTQLSDGLGKMVPRSAGVR